MKKNLPWIFIQLFYLSFLLTFLFSKSYSQQLWGTTSDGGGRKTGGNIFSINGDGTGFTERFPFFHDGEWPINQRLLDYGDGFLYGLAGNILFRHLYDGSLYQAMYVFQDATGKEPKTRLMKGQDGYLYGVSSSGGSNHIGVIYKVQKDGTGYQVLHHFSWLDGVPAVGRANLLQLSNGILYGTADNGGASSDGVVYRINPDGTGFQVLHDFNGTNGHQPIGGLISVSIGATTYLYGVASSGGANDKGVIYRIKPDGTQFSRQFNFTQASGVAPLGPLIKIGNVLYGITMSGGNKNGGVVFSFDADAQSYQKLHQFEYEIGETVVSQPTGPLLNLNGVIYGTTAWGGSYKNGVVYKINPNGTGYQVIHQLADNNGNSGSLSSVNDQIYGFTAGGIGLITPSHGTVYKLNADGTGFQTIHYFNDKDGYGPTGSLIRAQDGKIYGLTTYGGSGYSSGVAFNIQPDGSNYKVLQWLGNDPYAGNPTGTLVQASNSSFYGMNYQGEEVDPGQVFKLSVNVSVDYQVYIPFCRDPDCSQFPVGSLIQASDGNLYGMTPYTGGGSSVGEGNIFRINTAGTGYTLLKKFTGTNGAHPMGSLIQAPDGYLYGMTESGGLNGFGVIFKIRMDGTGFQKIFEFGTNANALYGAHPKGSLLVGSDGKLYGMTFAGGTQLGGTIFRIGTGGGAFSVLYNFNGSNGAFPVASLIEDVSTGFLFGMTEQGGASNFGTIFKIKKDGTSFQKLLDFNGYNGKYPKGDLLIVTPGGPTPQRNPTNAISELNPLNNLYKFSISPNPVQHSFTINFQKPVTGKIVYSVMDIQGRKLIQQTTEERSAVTMKAIDISRLPAGTYILELSASQEKFTQKIVKQ